MARKTWYHCIDKYKISAVCREPLHIGSASGDPAQVLTHPVDDVPFLQASGLAGVFRGYFEKRYEPAYVRGLFGGALTDGEEQTESRIHFTDGRFAQETLRLELRPRLKLNPTTGTAAASELKGTDRQSGQKFEMLYVSAGARIEFSVYLFSQDRADKERLRECLADIHAGNIQLGAQKSNGCGSLQLEEVLYRGFDLGKEEERREWFREDRLTRNDYQVIDLDNLPKPVDGQAYDIWARGTTEGGLLVKSIAVEGYGEEAPNAMNLRNGAQEYIVPASSVKGAFRGRMEMIAGYMGMEPQRINDLFGSALTESGEGGMGIFRFYDTVIGEKEDNDLADVRTRIHIDKFTGGVMSGALLREKNAAGSIAIHIGIRRGEPASLACGLTLLTLRDMALGQVTLGSGYSVGRGFVVLDEIEITDSEGKYCRLDMRNQSVQDDDKMLSACLKAVRERKHPEE